MESYVSSEKKKMQLIVLPNSGNEGHIHMPAISRQIFKDAFKDIYRDPAVRLGSFGFKKVKKNLKAVRVVSVPLRFGSSRFKKRFGSMSAIRVLPESNSNLAISFQSILCWNYF